MNYDIVLIETEQRELLYPFSIMHLSWEMRVGALRLFEKFRYLRPNSNLYFCSNDMLILQSFLERFEFDNLIEKNRHKLLLYGNIVPSIEMLNEIESIIKQNDNSPIRFNITNQTIGYFVAKEYGNNDLHKLHNNKTITTKELSVKLRKIEYLWEALDFVADEIESDANYRTNHFGRIKQEDYIGVYCIADNNILVAKGVDISPGVVLDARKGKILLDDNCKIMPNSTIIGPCYIGKNTIIKVGGKIYENCSFGEYCKVGGELEATIIQSYSNKQHEGFLGHSYISEWVNLGADTNNSDLKNTYSNIVMRLPGKRIPTGKMFIGLMAGDHIKSAINSQFTTGTTAGIFCNLFDSGFFPNQISSFTWGGSSNSKRHKLDDAIATAKIVKARRNKELLPVEIELIKREDKSL